MIKPNTVICCDCLEGLKDMADGSIDLVFTSPPYNIGIKYDIYNDAQPWDKYYQWCELWLKELLRVMKDDGRCCIVHYLSLGKADNRHSPLMDINYIAHVLGFNHHGLAIWWDITLTKRTAWGSWLSASAPYINSPFEGILFLYKNSWRKANQGITHISKEEFIEACSGIWKIPTERKRTHPAPFPIALAERAIKLLSYEDDVILDPFCGSGTTLVAAKRLNRKYIGMDISPTYCDMAEKRLSVEQAVLFDNLLIDNKKKGYITKKLWK